MINSQIKKKRTKIIRRDKSLKFCPLIIINQLCKIVNLPASSSMIEVANASAKKAMLPQVETKQQARRFLDEFYDYLLKNGKVDEHQKIKL